MPLAFDSLSHGTLAFGFYNVETDGLLLDRLFFFCTDFCRAALELEHSRRERGSVAEIPGYAFEDTRRIGNLHDAIQGVRHTGYLGEVYRLWPFPASPEAFRQRLHCASNREKAEELLGRWAAPSGIVLRFDAGTDRYAVGPYLFSREQYRKLLTYLWEGGYPTWESLEEGRRPAYVEKLAPLLGRSSEPASPAF
ncbi:MAG: hypothetical protein HY900_03760 [Deltaproteobacteria bacterium]|nr:hypothetical protein [Deltaproteobacteria bacterium]